LREAFLARLKEFAPVFAGEFREGDTELTANGGRSEVEEVSDLGVDRDEETRGLGFDAVVAVVGLGLLKSGGVSGTAVKGGEAG
jgi:hypothetical protein